jgi:ABC-type lipoprotein release transport system permease subunit
MTNNFRTFAERYYSRQRKRDRFMEIASWTAGIIGLVSCLGIFWMILVAIP